MMRWIVGSSLKFRFIVIAVAVGADVFRHRAAATKCRSTCSRSSPRRMVEIQTPSLGLSAEEVEELVTIPLEQALNGVPGLDVMRSKSVAQLSAVKMYLRSAAPICCWPGRLVQERMRQATGDHADLVRSAGDAAAALGHQPLHEDRHLVEEALGHRPFDDRLLDDPPAADATCPAWPTSPCGASGLKCCRCKSIPKRMAEHGVTLERVMEAAADALDVGILLQFSEGHYVGTRRLARDAQSAAADPPRAAHHCTRPTR